MKPTRYISYAILLLVASVPLSPLYASNVSIPEKKIVVIIASYNNQNWYEPTLKSLISQDYENWEAIYINDASTDETQRCVQQYLEKYDIHHRVTLINNPTRHGALANQYHAIHACNDTDIIIILDGDGDRFTDNQVLSYINAVYANPTIWLTYGQYRLIPSKRKGCCRAFPQDYINNNSFRLYPLWILSHPRTFYAGLFKKIKKEDLQINGEFLSVDSDQAMMFPMIEMASDHFMYISKTLYDYNTANILCDFKIHAQEQRDIELVIRNKEPYEKIESLF